MGFSATTAGETQLPFGGQSHAPAFGGGALLVIVLAIHLALSETHLCQTSELRLHFFFQSPGIFSTGLKSLQNRYSAVHLW